MAARSRLQRNDQFFQQARGGKADAESKVRRAFQRCAESGVLNLSEQGLAGSLPDSVCNFQEASHAECWWDQCPVTKIDVSHNTLESIPPDIGRLSECTVFVAVSNALRSVPDELLTELPLKQLNLRLNQLTTLPGAAFACAEQLVELVLTENRLASLPVEVFGLPDLQVLEVASNQLTELPDIAWACQKLKRLVISKNRLGPCLPSGLAACGTLRELAAGSNELEEVGRLLSVGPGHGWRESLTAVDLSQNQLSVLRVAGLDALDSLNIAGNRIASLDLGVRAPRLSVLLAESNKIQEFPAALLPSGAPLLNTLDLSNNSLGAVPPELGLSQVLKRVALGGNPIRSIRPELLRGSAENLKKYLLTRIEGLEEREGPSRAQTPAAAAERFAVELRTATATHDLSLDGHGLAALPLLPPGLQVLSVTGNKLSAAALAAACGLPGTASPDPDLGADLRILRAARNALGGGPVDLLPRLVRGFPSLQELDLSFNQLSAADPPGSWAWALQPGSRLALKHLDLGGNALTVVPGELLAACPALNELRLRQNRIMTLEDLAMAAGSGLSVLDMEENSVRDVPPWLPTALPRLKTLLLANNEIGPSLPPELGFWESLQAVSLVGNPLRNIRQTLLAKGWPTIADCLRDRLPDGATRSVAVPDQAAARQVYAPPARSSARPPSGEVPAPGAIPTRAPPDVRPPSGGAPATPSSLCSGPPRAAGDLAGTQLERLHASVAALEQELSAPGLSRSKQSALNHSLRMKRAELLKAERELSRAAAVASELGDA